jgi:hypothetical protein
MADLRFQKIPNRLRGNGNGGWVSSGGRSVVLKIDTSQIPPKKLTDPWCSLSCSVHDVPPLVFISFSTYLIREGR